MKEKNSWVGATSWYHCVAEDSRMPKMPVINPLQALVHPQTQKKKKKLSCMDCQSPTPTSQNSPFLVNRSTNYELCISIFQGNDELVCSKKSKFAVLVLGFEKLVLELDNCGQTTENAYRLIYSLWSDVGRHSMKQNFPTNSGHG